MIHKHHFDTIIIGGSYAGLSAAMALGRSLKNVLIIDSGKPCNSQTPHSHNLITHDGKTPQEISAEAKQQVLKYDTVTFHEGLAINGKKTDDGFEIGTQAGDVFTAKKLIFATGVKDLMPAIKGFQECWGISVVHCPYCHGYEFRDRKTAIMANGERGFHLASLVNNLTNSITILTSGKAEFSAEQLEKLNKHQIQIIETPVSEIEHDNGNIKTITFDDGKKLNFDVAYASIPFAQHTDLPASLGCELTEQGYIKVDGFQKTSVAGIYACGDNSSMMRALANAIFTGNMSGAMVNRELTEERF
jgi:thioredoxin reductase